MSKLLKSKFFLGALMAFAFVGATSSALAYTHTMTLKMGMRNSQVMSLQQTLNMTTCKVGAVGTSGGPGTETTYFGAKTKVAVQCFQASKGLTADGIVGPITGSALAMVSGSVSVTPGVFPAGCSSAAGYSPLTGMACNGAVSSSFPAGCTSSSGFSPTTGAKCDSSVPVSTGTNGYLADISLDSSNRVSTVYESETDKVVAGIRMTARLSDQTVDRVRVTFLNTNTTASANLAKYITSASLWYGTTKLQTIPVASADRATSSDTYTFNFSGLNAKILKDQVGRFSVSVNANGSLDSVDATNANWTVRFIAGGISASSPDGSYDTYPSADLVQTGLLFGKFASSGVKATVSLSSSNPAATTLAVSDTAVTNDVTLLKFTIKSTNSDLTLRKVPIQVVTSTASVSSVINTIKLYKGSVLLDSKDGASGVTVAGGVITSGACTTTCGFIFDNLSSPDNKIASGTTGDYSVVVDLKSRTGNYAAGETIKASLQNGDVLLASNFSVQDVNGDQLPANSSVRVGSAVGEVMTLLVNGINVTQGAASITTTTDAGVVTSTTYNIPLTVTSFGQTLYTGQAAELALVPTGTGASAKAFSYVLQEAAAPAVDITSAPAGTTITSTLSSNAAIENLGYRLDSGSTKNYTLQVIVSCNPSSCSGATTANYRVRVAGARTFTDNALSAGASNQTLLPVQNYQTSYQKIK